MTHKTTKKYRKTANKRRRTTNKHRRTTNKHRRTTNKHRRTTNKHRRNNKKVFKKGGNGEDKVNCCVCGDEVNISDTLMPSICKMKHGNKAHRICQECWWNPETGFGKETSKHKCPGCVKELPLTKVEIEKPLVIDLTEDD